MLFQAIGAILLFLSANLSDRTAPYDTHDEGRRTNITRETRARSVGSNSKLSNLLRETKVTPLYVTRNPESEPKFAYLLAVSPCGNKRLELDGPPQALTQVSGSEFETFVPKKSRWCPYWPRSDFIQPVSDKHPYPCAKTSSSRIF